MQDFLTYALALFLVLSLVYIQKTKTIKDLDRLQEINTDIKKRFNNYKGQLYNLSLYVVKHVDDRNEIIMESLRIIDLLVDQSNDNHELINTVLIDTLINDINILIKRSGQEENHDYQQTLLYLKSLRKQNDLVNDRIKHETKLIKKLLMQSSKHMKESVAELIIGRKM